MRRVRPTGFIGSLARDRNPMTIPTETRLYAAAAGRKLVDDAPEMFRFQPNR